ncbi:MAG: tRNA-dihydrouridine synthase [Patescibacteria group bacterium]|nr:tRNA-dihydrouridine synthase [Patescibacteria group bacterium]MDD5715182.1 tRNA-dihydrouridine synthase [Patescibacteria group bacterium]
MPHSLWANLPRPVICLAPMDGYTDSAFRRTCKTVNRNIVVFTEFVSADGLHHKAKKLQEKLRFHNQEHPIIAQIFGKNAESYITAAKYCETLGFDGIDINMGCPSKKVVKSEHGVALRKKPDLAYRLIESISTATKLPISVKTRLGWDSADDLITFGKGVENAGAQLITVHGRTYKQGFSDHADFNPLYALKRELTIPVIGNGDIADMSDGMKKLGNLDGFMIGRASIGNPWVFAKLHPANFSDKIALILKHAELLWQLKGEKVAMLEIRKHLLAYVKGLPNASEYRSKLVQVTSINEIHGILKALE